LGGSSYQNTTYLISVSDCRKTTKTNEKEKKKIVDILVGGKGTRSSKGNIFS